MRLVAPLAGAGLYALVGGAAVALVDAGTFLVSAGFLLTVHARDIDRQGDGAFWPELRAGLRHIVRTADLRRLTIGTAIVMLVVGMSEVFIFAVIDEGLHRHAAFLGIISSVEGVGSIVAGLIVGTHDAADRRAAHRRDRLGGRRHRLRAVRDGVDRRDLRCVDRRSASRSRSSTSATSR